jgi:hypothetical protein
MTNWYYYDDNRQMQGVYSDGQLQWLAMHGIVTPDTLVESDAGGVSQAKKVKGLVFVKTTRKKPFLKAINKQRVSEQKWYKFAILLAVTLWVFFYTGAWWLVLICWLIWGTILAVFLTPIMAMRAAQEASDFVTSIMSSQE